jgi:hypothetical protein
MGMVSMDESFELIVCSLDGYGKYKSIFGIEWALYVHRMGVIVSISLLSYLCVYLMGMIRV